MSVSRSKNMLDAYLSFIETKQELLNDPKFIEYCFHKPIKKITSIHQICEYFDEENYEKQITHITYLQDTYIPDTIGFMYEYMKRYRFYYKRGVKINKINNEHILLVQKYNKHELLVLKYLKDFKRNNIMSYIPKWTFKLSNKSTEQLNNKLPNITISNTFVYDFFGVLKENNRLILFVINLENQNQNINHNTKLLFQQYILNVMNINYLRININENIEKQLHWFFKKLKNGKYYVCNKFIKPNGNNINSEILLKSLEKFYDDYYKNHLVYYKICEKENFNDHVKDLSGGTEVELIGNSGKEIDYYIDKNPADKSYKISNQMYNDIIKNIYVPIKQKNKRDINDEKVNDMMHYFLRKKIE
uniref:DUF5889 domain-containing protein n=1 Tax=Moumouvirus sp. 'Monve' TaxID=1128131 RepID=H2EDH1_9VIRU|nr:hypothetical protein mv_L239 [Moumouvirus Monve]